MFYSVAVWLFFVVADVVVGYGSFPIGTTTFPNQLPEALLAANVGALGVLLGEPTAS